MLNELLAALMFAGAAAPAGQSQLLRDAGRPAICVHHLPGSGPAVLFVHGATFPAALSINYRLRGKSWADDLRQRGFDVWSFDFVGYGCSERHILEDAAEVPGRSADAADQIGRVVEHIRRQTHDQRISIIAHSWGTIPAGLFAGLHPERLERLVLFGPIARRHQETDPVGHKINFVTAERQWRSFQSGLPENEPLPISRGEFDDWANAYLATDKTSSGRTPPSVAVPAGPDADINGAWAGHLPYDPSQILTPTLIVRGEWDPITRDADAAWLVTALSRVPGGARDVRLPQGAHRMHLERNRQALFDAIGDFLTQAER